MIAPRGWLRPIVVVFLMLFSLSVVPVVGSAQGSGEAARPCLKGGWQDVRRTDGTRFASQGECVNYAVQGGVLVATGTVRVGFETTTQDVNFCLPVVTLQDFRPNTTYTAEYWIKDTEFETETKLSTPSITTDSEGNAEYRATTIIHQHYYDFQVIIGGVSTGYVDITC